MYKELKDLYDSGSLYVCGLKVSNLSLEQLEKIQAFYGNYFDESTLAWDKILSHHRECLHVISLKKSYAEGSLRMNGILLSQLPLGKLDSALKRVRNSEVEKAWVEIVKQELENRFNEFREEHRSKKLYWPSEKGRMLVQDMDDSHILNCLKRFKAKTYPSNSFDTIWTEIFKEELFTREAAKAKAKVENDRVEELWMSYYNGTLTFQDIPISKLSDEEIKRVMKLSNGKVIDLAWVNIFTKELNKRVLEASRLAKEAEDRAERQKAALDKAMAKRSEEIMHLYERNRLIWISNGISKFVHEMSSPQLKEAIKELDNETDLYSNVFKNILILQLNKRNLLKETHLMMAYGVCGVVLNPKAVVHVSAYFSKGKTATINARDEQLAEFLKTYSPSNGVYDRYEKMKLDQSNIFKLINFDIINVEEIKKSYEIVDTPIGKVAIIYQGDNKHTFYKVATGQSTKPVIVTLSNGSVTVTRFIS